MTDSVRYFTLEGMEKEETAALTFFPSHIDTQRGEEWQGTWADDIGQMISGCFGFSHFFELLKSIVSWSLSFFFVVVRRLNFLLDVVVVIQADRSMRLHLDYFDRCHSIIAQDFWQHHENLLLPPGSQAVIKNRTVLRRQGYGLVLLLMIYWFGADPFLFFTFVLVHSVDHFNIHPLSFAAAVLLACVCCQISHCKSSRGQALSLSLSLFPSSSSLKIHIINFMFVKKTGKSPMIKPSFITFLRKKDDVTSITVELRLTEWHNPCCCCYIQKAPIEFRLGSMLSLFSALFLLALIF